MTLKWNILEFHVASISTNIYIKKTPQYVDDRNRTIRTDEGILAVWCSLKIRSVEFVLNLKNINFSVTRKIFWYTFIFQMKNF